MTDDQINVIRKLLVVDTIPWKDDIDALCDMALAHNAAKRGEPVACLADLKSRLCGLAAYEHSDVSIGREAAFEIERLERKLADLAAKLKEARELLERWKWIDEMRDREFPKFSAVQKDTDDFLARTK